MELGWTTRELSERQARTAGARGGRRAVAHAKRPALDGRHPVHVTLRAHRRAPSFRSDLVAAIARQLFEELGEAGLARWRREQERAARRRRGKATQTELFGAVRAGAATAEGEGESGATPKTAGAGSAAARRWKFRRHRRETDEVAAGFHVAHYSLQEDHVHLIVEASDARALSLGMRRLVIRLAKRVNRVVRRKPSGKIWGERYHRHDLREPREVRHALVYVLQNGHKHGHVARGKLDRLSSATYFDGFRDRRPEVRAPDGLAPRTWLLGIGWRRGGGQLRVTDVPLPTPTPRLTPRVSRPPTRARTTIRR